MNKSKLYSEIAHDHDSLLMQRKIAALKKEYPNPNTFVRAYVLLIGLMPLLLIPLMYSLSGGASDMMYIALCIFVVYALLFWQMISIIRSWKQRKVAKESEIERYKGWLEQVKSSGKRIS
jgi:protein-S-isoprenylcysteine O-methyltransferase Ste14